MENKVLMGLTIIFWLGILAVYIRYTNKQKIFLKFAIFVLIAVAFFDLPVGYVYYRYSCNVDAGQHMYQQVSGKGYLAEDDVVFGCGGGPCGGKLSQLYKEGKNLFIEGKVISQSETGMAPEQGLYRFYLASMDSSECDNFKTEFLEKRPQVAPRYLPDNMCIAGLAIDKYTTPYQYERKQEFFFSTIYRETEAVC
jgi:hypothetical protein